MGKLIQVSFKSLLNVDFIMILLSLDEPTLITGDINICLKKKPSNLLTTWLLQRGFSQLVTSATHIQGGLIDHIYWLDTHMKWKIPVVEMYSPYYSDHDCMLITLNKS